MAFSGRDVLLGFGGSPPVAVIAVNWIDGDVVVSLCILSQPDGGFDADTALEIAAAFMDQGVDIP